MTRLFVLLTAASALAGGEGGASINVRLTMPAAEHAWVAAAPAREGTAALHPALLPPGESRAIAAEAGVPYLVCAGAAGAATQCRVARAGGAITFALDAGRAVEGRVVVGREASEGARVFVLLPGVESRKPAVLPASWDEKGFVLSVTTDREGRFRFEHLAAGEHVFEVDLRGGRQHESGTIVVPVRRAGEDANAVVRLRDIHVDAGAMVAVTVQDDTGLPVPHASVGILQQRGTDDPLLIEGEADAAGRASLSGFDPLLPADVTCMGKGLARSTTHWDALPAAVTCVAARFGRVTAHVRNDSGEPVHDAVLRIGEQSAHTNAAGDVELRDVKPGSYAAEVNAVTYSARSVEAKVEPGKAADLGTIRLEPGRVVKGRVIDADAKTPIAGAAAGSSMTDAEGRFTTTVDARGQAQIRVAAAGYGVKDVVVPEDQELIVPLARAGSLEVKAWNDDGSPCAGCSITVMGNGTSASLTAEASGIARFDDLSPGTYQVNRERVHARAGAVFVSGGSARLVAVRSREVTRIEIGSPSREVRIVTTPPLTGPWVLHALSASTMQSVTADATGAFTIRKRDGEACTLQVESPAFGIRLGVISADFADSLFTAPLGRSSLRAIVTRNGIPVAGELLTLTDNAGRVAWGRTAPDGSIVLQYLPAGAFVLATETQRVTSLTIPAGAALDLGRLYLPPIKSSTATASSSR